MNSFCNKKIDQEMGPGKVASKIVFGKTGQSQIMCLKYLIGSLGLLPWPDLSMIIFQSNKSQIFTKIASPDPGPIMFHRVVAE